MSVSSQAVGVSTQSGPKVAATPVTTSADEAAYRQLVEMDEVGAMAKQLELETLILRELRIIKYVMAQAFGVDLEQIQNDPDLD